MNKILETSITGDAERDKMIKAAILTNAIGERTGKSANRRELLAAYEATKFLSNNKDLVEPEEKPQTTPPPSPTPQPPTEEPPTTIPPSNPTPPQEEPCKDYQDRYSGVISSRKVRGHGQSPYWISQAYVTPDGKELTAAQRKDLQKQLGKIENKQAQVRENGHIGYQYKNVITLSDGKEVVLAKDAADRIGTGQIKKMRTVIVNGKAVRQVRAVHCGTNTPIDGPEGDWHDE